MENVKKELSKTLKKTVKNVTIHVLNVPEKVQLNVLNVTKKLIEN